MKSMRADFLDFLNAGKISHLPFVVVNGKKVYPETGKKSAGDACIQFHFEYKNGMIDDFYYTGNTCVRKFQNCKKMQKINELGLTLSGISFGGKVADDYFYHNENPRIYERMTFKVDFDRTSGDAPDSEFDEQAGNRWADPGVVCERIGRSPYQPFPAIHLGNYASKHGIVHGTLSQDYFYHNYLAYHEGGKVSLDIYSSFKAVDYLEVPAGKILRDEWYLGATDHADDLDKLFQEYTAVLRKKLPVNYGATDLNRDNLVWGSWNDGIFRDVSEKMLLKEAAYLKKNFPTVRWIQLDDGYSKFNKVAFGLGVPYSDVDGIDTKKFPKGLRHYTDELRKIGLRPAIWIGGFCPVETQIYKDHPEWFSDYTFRVKHTQPLDVSIPVVREFMEHALDVLITEYGFDGVKHDFWSYAFEESHSLYKNKTESGYFYRKWWLNAVRKRLSDDGYFQTGCDIVMGNPFLGQYFTNYRYGIDIGGGNWDYVKTNFLWGAACFALHTSDLFVPNSDSIGLFPGLNDVDAMFALNYCIATRSMVEIAGKLSENQNHPRLPLLRKAACNVNNGQELWLLDYDYRKPGINIPKGVYFKSGFFTSEEENPNMPLRNVGLFNIFDKNLKVSFNAAKLGLDRKKSYTVVDVWTHKEYDLAAGKSLNFTLEPHGSMMLAVCEKDLVLQDATVKVNTVSKDGKTLSVDCAYAYPDAEFLFSSKVRSVTFNGKAVKASVKGGLCKMELKNAGVYTFTF